MYWLTTHSNRHTHTHTHLFMEPNSNLHREWVESIYWERKAPPVAFKPPFLPIPISISHKSCSLSNSQTMILYLQIWSPHFTSCCWNLCVLYINASSPFNAHYYYTATSHSILSTLLAKICTLFLLNEIHRKLPYILSSSRIYTLSYKPTKNVKLTIVSASLLFIEFRFPTNYKTDFKG